MLKDCIEVFKKHYEKNGEGYLLDDYILDEGDYLLIDKEGNCKLSLHANKYDGNEERDSRYELFCRLDLFSRLIDTNKYAGTNAKSKCIHSNNYLSFFIKKETLTNGKLTESVIDDYFDTLSNPNKKNKKNKKAYELYKPFENEFGPSNLEILERNRKWIKTHLTNFNEEYPDIAIDETYLKIFFEDEISRYEIESNRYFITNIYNNIKSNVEIGDLVYGMPNNNIGLNKDKDFLKCLTRKNPTPYLIESNEIWLQKKFFDFLRNKANQRRTNIYIDDDIHCLPADKSVDFPFSGYYMRIRKGIEIVIEDFDIIAYLNNSISTCVIPKSIEIDYSATQYQSELNTLVVDQISDLKRMINRLFFDKKLEYSYYTDPAKLNVKNRILKQSILQSREAFFEWFYKGNEALIKPIFPKISLDLIKNAIGNGFYLKAKEQWMLREGIIHYLNRGDTQMAGNMKEKLDIIEEKINSPEQEVFENDLEYSIAVGQLTNYFLSLSKASSPKHSLVNPILNLKNDQQIKGVLKKLFIRYNYKIDGNSKRFNNLYSMVQGYNPDKIHEDAIIYGYITNSLIYKKGTQVDE